MSALQLLVLRRNSSQTLWFDFLYFLLWSCPSCPFLLLLSWISVVGKPRSPTITEMKHPSIPCGPKACGVFSVVLHKEKELLTPGVSYSSALRTPLLALENQQIPEQVWFVLTYVPLRVKYMALFLGIWLDDEQNKIWYMFTLQFY